jgi:2-C-methyl-D-erythritol 2,4-cyclodiphosphate synthase
MAKTAAMLRIGQGIDFHKMVEGRDFWLGGIKIPHHKGALGHTEADVQQHAIRDALLGALSLGDIGQHFPDTDPAYKGIDSKVLLAKTYELVRAKGYHLVNADSTILLQAPKIRKYVDDMRTTIAGILGVENDAISIKATTTEQLSFIGREEGIVATANVLLMKD